MTLDMRPINIVSLATVCDLYHTRPDQFTEGTLVWVVEEEAYFVVRKGHGGTPSSDVISCPYGPPQPGCTPVEDDFGGTDPTRYVRLAISTGNPFAHAETRHTGPAITIAGDGEWHNVFVPAGMASEDGLWHMTASIHGTVAADALVSLRWLVGGVTNDLVSKLFTASVPDSLAIAGYTPGLTAGSHQFILQARVIPEDQPTDLSVSSGSSMHAHEVGLASG